MRAADRKGEKRRWTAAVIAAAAFGGGALALFRLPPPIHAEPGPVLRSAALVVPTAGDPLVAEEAQLEDPRPLFLPTAWNSTRKALRPPELGEFPGYRPRFAFATDSLDLKLPAPVSVPSGPQGALGAAPAPGFDVAGVGRSDAAVPALPTRQALVRVVDAGTGRTVLTRPLPRGAVPGLDGRAWETQEFLASVDAAGFVAPPTPLAPRLGGGRAFPPLDRDSVSALENNLVRTLHLGQELRPGVYRISVGP